MRICWKYALIKTYYFSTALARRQAALDDTINAFKMHIHKHSQHETEQTQNKNRLIRKNAHKKFSTYICIYHTDFPVFIYML